MCVASHAAPAFLYPFWQRPTWHRFAAAQDFLRLSFDRVMFDLPAAVDRSHGHDMPRIGSGIHAAVLDYFVSYRTTMAINPPFLLQVTVQLVV